MAIEKTYIVCVQVQDADADLLQSDLVEAAIRARFAGTAFRIIECEPQRKDVVPPERKAYDVRARELGF
jgi:hypothetical protein